MFFLRRIFFSGTFREKIRAPSPHKKNPAMSSELYPRDDEREKQIRQDEAEILKVMDAAVTEDSECWFNAVERKRRECYELHGFSLNPISVAVEHGRLKVVKRIVDTPRDKFGGHFLMQQCEADEPHIARAVLVGDFEMVKLLVECDIFDINALYNVCDDGVTALAIACRNGNAAIAEYLIENGADMNKYNPVLNGCEAKPLYHAIRAGMITTINLMLKHVSVSYTINNGCDECRFDYSQGPFDYMCVDRNCVRAFHKYHGDLALFHPIVEILCVYGFYPRIDLAENHIRSPHAFCDFISHKHSVLVAEMYARHCGGDVDKIAAILESPDNFERPLAGARYYLTRDRVRLTKMFWMLRNRDDAPLNRWEFPVPLFKWILAACGLFVFANEWTAQ